jgi:hypothetical protein
MPRGESMFAVRAVPDVSRLEVERGPGAPQNTALTYSCTDKARFAGLSVTFGRSRTARPRVNPALRAPAARATGLTRRLKAVRVAGYGLDGVETAAKARGIGEIQAGLRRHRYSSRRAQW